MPLSLSLPAPCSDPLAELQRIFRNSLASVHAQRAYIAAFNQFFVLAAQTGRPVCRALLMEYRAQMIDQAPSKTTKRTLNSAVIWSDSAAQNTERIGEKIVNEGMKVSLSNPLGTFLGSSVMFLAGIVLGEHWRPPGAIILAVTVLGAVLAALHELLTCFLWCSFTSWWIGRRMGELKAKR
jgi:hypothetical protein